MVLVGGWHVGALPSTACPPTHRPCFPSSPFHFFVFFNSGRIIPTILRAGGACYVTASVKHLKLDASGATVGVVMERHDTVIRSPVVISSVGARATFAQFVPEKVQSLRHHFDVDIILAPVLPPLASANAAITVPHHCDLSSGARYRALIGAPRAVLLPNCDFRALALRDPRRL